MSKSIRERLLPPGWYPSGVKDTTETILAMSRRVPKRDGGAIAGVVPHAGWEFSGTLALEVMACISRSIDTIVIIGGHLGPSDGILCCMEDAFETPLGEMGADGELRDWLIACFNIREDRTPDNSVEVQLPFARYLFPRARLVGLRAPPSPEAARLGAEIAAAARRMERKVAVIGSTDLTHYGPNYGFSPAGQGERALSWVRDVNDRHVVDALTAMDCSSVLELASRERSMCSAGGALGAMSFALGMGVTKGQLLRYMTSHEVHPAQSFVGYAGVLYGP